MWKNKGFFEKVVTNNGHRLKVIVPTKSITMEEAARRARKIVARVRKKGRTHILLKSS